VNAQSSTFNDVLDRLLALVEVSTNGRMTASRADLGTDSIRRLGLDSLGMLTFLVAVEDEFGIEWDDDVPPEVTASFEGVAAHVAKELGLDAA
jgi:acyl carrier protein